MIAQLPDDVLGHVFAHLNGGHALVVRVVCKRWCLIMPPTDMDMDDIDAVAKANPSMMRYAISMGYMITPRVAQCVAATGNMRLVHIVLEHARRSAAQNRMNAIHNDSYVDVVYAACIGA